MLSIEKKNDFSGEGFRNGGGFGKSEWRDTIPLRLVAFNLQNPVNATVTYVKKDQYIRILLFCVTKFIHWTKSLGLTKPGDSSPAADYTAKILYAKWGAGKYCLTPWPLPRNRPAPQLPPSPQITITVLLHQQWTTGHYCCRTRSLCCVASEKCCAGGRSQGLQQGTRNRNQEQEKPNCPSPLVWVIHTSELLPLILAEATGLNFTCFHGSKYTTAL